MKEFEKKENLQYPQRIGLVQNHFLRNLSLLYRPHNHLRDNEEAMATYMKEVCEAINSRISADVPNSESYKDILRTIWRTVTSKHKSSFYFNLADIISATVKANRNWEAKSGTKKTAKAFSGSFEAEQQAREGEQKKPETVEGWLAKLEETDRMIASGELGRGIGEILRRIPLRGIERLTGEKPDIAPPAKQETPKEHLPDDSGKINMDLIKAGHTAPVFDEFDLAAPLDDPLPDNMKAPLPDFNQI
jgi:hypothetical protein